MDPLRVNAALEALATTDAELLREKRGFELQFEAAQREENRELAAARARRDETLSSIDNMRDSLRSLGSQLGVHEGAPDGQVLPPHTIHAQENALRQRWENVAVLEAAERAHEQQRHMDNPKRILIWTWVGLAVVGLAATVMLPSLMLG